MRRLLALVLVLTVALTVVTGQRAAIAESSGVDVLIGFWDPPDLSIIESVNGRVTHTYSIIPAVAARIPPGAVRTLAKHPAIRYIEPDVHVTASGLQTKAQTIPWGVSRIGATTVHSWGNTGAGVKIGIIDTGIQTDHPDLVTYGGYNFIANNTNYNDDHGHGTYVAGVAACLDNTIGYLGVAPGARLYGVKVLNSSGSGSLSTVIYGIDWCVSNGMAVINMSFGSTYGSTTLQAVCQYAYDAGIVLAAAANGVDPSGTVVFPARYSSVIAVVGVDAEGQPLPYSPSPDRVELAAPGAFIPSAWIGGGYMTLTGVSGAVPHVSATAALVKYRYPAWNSYQIRTRMRETAEWLSSGYPLVRADLSVGSP